jgi:hypothetical protein
MTEPRPPTPREMIDALDRWIARCEAAPGFVTARVALLLGKDDVALLRAIREALDRAAGGRR